MTDSLRRQVLDDPTIPEPVRKALASGMVLEEIRLDAHGRWWHRGEAIDHPRIVQLFSESVQQTEGGTFVLHIWHFTYPIVVVDTPYFVVRIDWRSEGPPQLVLNDGSTEALSPDALRLDGTRLVIPVKDGQMTARFLRDAYHDLLDRVEDDDGVWVLALGAQRVPLTRLDEGA